MTKTIALTRGQSCIVDDEDYEGLSRHQWCFHPGGYAFRLVHSHSLKVAGIMMHREILGVGASLEVDHISGDGLDNRRRNLRVATREQNAQNRKKSRLSKRPYKGVHKHASGWRALIQAHRVKYDLGIFATAIEAARAYDDAAHVLHGPFARANGV